MNVSTAVGWCGTKVPGVIPKPDPNPDPFKAISGLLDKIGLNPQPLPPTQLAGSLLSGASKFADEFCGTVPHKLPGFPPTPPLPGGILR